MKQRIKIYIILTVTALFLLQTQVYPKKKKKVKLGKPSRMVKKLYLDLRFHRFSNVAGYSIGTMANWINQINRFLLEAPKKKIITFKASFSRLYEIRIYDEYIKGKYAFVQSLWVYKSPPNTMYKYKVRDQIHLLEKKKGKWYLRNYKFQGEHIIHDIEKVRRIQKRARQMDRRRGPYRRRRPKFKYHRRGYRRR